MMTIDQDRLKEICSRYKVRELSLFGSSVAGAAGPDSDVDLLVDFEPEAALSLFDMVELREEFKELFGGREVDLVSKDALLKHHNTIRRRSILDHTEMLYAA